MSLSGELRSLTVQLSAGLKKDALLFELSAESPSVSRCPSPVDDTDFLEL